MEKTIKEVFYKNFEGLEDYDKSDVSWIMASEIIEKLNLDINDFKIEKLTREDKEFITDLDYRTPMIESETLIRHYADFTMYHILVKILDNLSEGKSISRQVKKWITE